jgi:cyclin-dependent kinase 7
VKDQKVGEGTYAVVYRGSFTLISPLHAGASIDDYVPSSGRELATGRKIAIKKIKVGQFKDGLDMSAVREVKYLRELHHPNIIEVRIFSLSLSLPRVANASLPPSTTHAQVPHFSFCLCFIKLLDVFSSKTNLNLVLEFLDTDLEMIIKERSLVFLPADIKSWMAMTFRGLEFCHRNFILHRVRVFFFFSASPGLSFSFSDQPPPPPSRPICDAFAR